jgi:GNAT superfamily N-acetyltransferase
LSLDVPEDKVCKSFSDPSYARWIFAGDWRIGRHRFFARPECRRKHGGPRRANRRTAASHRERQSAWPYTERLHYAVGGTIHWRIINTTFQSHPNQRVASFKTVYEYRKATIADVPAMALCRAHDAVVGAADDRMLAYFKGSHHPRLSLSPRVGYVAVADEIVVGYIAGHETQRFNCSGELQYLYVMPQYRRQHVGMTLLKELARWFRHRGATRVCVDVNAESPPAAPFYAACGAERINEHWFVWPDVSSVLGPSI